MANSSFKLALVAGGGRDKVLPQSAVGPEGLDGQASRLRPADCEQLGESQTGLGSVGWVGGSKSKMRREFER